MNQLVKIPLVDQLQNAERRYYVALQQYVKAAKSSAPAQVKKFKEALCDAFTELKAAQDQLDVDCDA